MKKIVFNLLLNLMGVLILASCSGDLFSSAAKSLGIFQPTTVWLQRVSFRVSEYVNDSSPVTVHVVIPYTTDLGTQLSKLSATDYFAKIDQIKLDNAGKIDVFEWELVRSQSLDNLPVNPHSHNGVGVFVFAQYSTPGDHRATVGPDESVTILLNDNDFVIQPNN